MLNLLNPTAGIVLFASLCPHFSSSWQLVDEEQLTVSMNRPPPLLLDALFKQKPDTQAMRTTVRQQRLLRLRALFIPLYQDAVPSVAGAPRPWMEWVKSLIGHHY